MVAGHAVARYLAAIRGGDAVERLREELASAVDPLERVRLADLLAAAESSRPVQHEEGFVRNAKTWSELHEVSGVAFRAEGVCEEVLARAGLTATPAEATPAGNTGDTGGPGADPKPDMPAGAGGSGSLQRQVRLWVSEQEPGATLTSREAAETLGVSESVARKALTELTEWGYLDRSAGVGPGKRRTNFYRYLGGYGKGVVS